VPEGYWLIADRQTAGRGRQGRRWFDGPGNFMGSTVVNLTPHDPPAATLSFVAALAVYEAVVTRLASPAALSLKWPNDVLLGGTKFCGLLLEREGEHAVVGIGVNLAKAPPVEDRATDSLAGHGPTPARDAFAQALARIFDLELSRWREFGLGPILGRWLAAAHAVGTPLSVHDGSGERIDGAFAGLAPDGALRLRLADGDVRVIHAGDVELTGG
jgi:BirA family biotin operon repressor/biotin-[acetyl-CoA-carboxylase] ligase